jgi:hypothetical protein
LRNLETNLFEYPIESNQTSALFIDLVENIYQVEFSITKENDLSFIQMTNYSIQISEYIQISLKKQNFLLEFEDLNFLCKLNEKSQQIVFYWSNFTSPFYHDSNLTIGLAIEKNKNSWNTSCDPYVSNGICSTNEYRLQPGTEYRITAKLTKVLKNSIAQKNGTCLIKTSREIIFHHEI